MTEEATPTVAVLLGWSATRFHVDPLTGSVSSDRRSEALTAADEAALEVALRIGEAWHAEVVACSAGPAAVASALEQALSVGASRAIRAEVPESADVRSVASALASALVPLRPMVVVAGAHGVDFGSGAVPALVAHALGAAQALGLVEIHPRDGGVIEGIRRADRGARERVRVVAPAVVSVEGSAARLRRAGLRAALGAPGRPIEVVVGTAANRGSGDVRMIGALPYRPRPKVVAAPKGSAALDRILQLTGATTERTPPRTVELAPDDAAEAILTQLGVWGLGPRAAGER